MSINEVVAMYESGELEVHPEFQRIFRWSLEQQSRLVESVMLGIPIPMIFVAQRKDGVWDVIDGVQRLSTLLRFLGALKREDGAEDSPSPLVSGDYLTGLTGVVWDASKPLVDANGDPYTGGTSELDESQRRVFKRARLDFTIIQSSSDEQAKYDLFQRLNSGTRLSEQEARNCLAVMLDATFAKWLEALAKFPAYDSTVDISDRKEQEAYGMESVLRYLACVNTSDAELSKMGDVGEFLTKRMRFFIGDTGFNRDKQASTFESVFGLIDQTLGSDAFKRYNPDLDRFTGKFSISAFEAIATGLARNIDKWLTLDASEAQNRLRAAAIAVWNDSVFKTRSGGGKPANRRIPYMVEVGTRIFAEHAA
ncbi:MAG TPA: DUF262 domain-containing protein [Mycobacteriales bacterium]|nr:DUF262 domain-containing protein [Mycobacteriales bacterium]